MSINFVDSVSGTNFPPHTSTRINLDLTSVNAVTDDNVGTTAIVVNAKPATPTYTKAIGSLPSSSSVASWAAILVIGGKSTGTTGNVNWRFTLNGTDIGAGDGSVSAVNNDFWYASGRFGLNALAATDTLGVKLWIAAGSTIDYRYSTLYIIPRLLSRPASNEQARGIAANLTLVGAATGVTYTGNMNASGTITDTETGTAITFAGGVALSGDTFSNFASAADNNALASTGSATVATLPTVINLMKTIRIIQLGF
jgi:hypothetical protein